MSIKVELPLQLCDLEPTVVKPISEIDKVVEAKAKAKAKLLLVAVFGLIEFWKMF